MNKTHHYIARITNLGDHLNVYFPDIPNCKASGRTLNEALGNAKHNLYSYLLSRVNKGFPEEKFKAGNDGRIYHEFKVSLVDLLEFERARRHRAVFRKY